MVCVDEGKPPDTYQFGLSLLLDSGGQFFESVLAASPEQLPTLMAFKSAEMPRQWLDYNAFDVVYLTLPQLEKLRREEPAAFAAILAWVLAGGNLWVSHVGGQWQGMPQLEGNSSACRRPRAAGRPRVAPIAPGVAPIAPGVAPIALLSGCRRHKRPTVGNRPIQANCGKPCRSFPSSRTAIPPAWRPSAGSARKCGNPAASPARRHSGGPALSRPASRRHPSRHFSAFAAWA